MKPRLGDQKNTWCDACYRQDKRCEYIIRSGIDLWICVAWRECKAAQPTIDVMAGGVR